MSDIEIVLLGNRGSGKTTLLAAMAHELAMNPSRFKPLVLEPEAKEFALLDQKWAEQLERLETEVSFTGEYAGTRSIIRHPFVFTDGRASQLFSFVDTPGGQTYESSPQLDQLVAKAFALFCVVDAVELMEHPLASAQDRCAVAGLRSLLQKATASRCETCLFVLTKCEKYMHSSTPKKNAKALARKFIECFKPVLELEKLTSFYLPVETLGCLEFAGFEGAGGDRKCRWVRTAVDPKPVNTFVPLCFAMIEMLEKLERKKMWAEKFWNWFSSSEEYERYVVQLLTMLGKVRWLCRYDSKQLVDFSAELRKKLGKVKM